MIWLYILANVYPQNSLQPEFTKHAPFQIDGEPEKSEEEYKVNIIPGCFKLLQPVHKSWIFVYGSMLLNSLRLHYLADTAPHYF